MSPRGPHASLPPTDRRPLERPEEDQYDLPSERPSVSTDPRWRPDLWRAIASADLPSVVPVDGAQATQTPIGWRSDTCASGAPGIAGKCACGRGMAQCMCADPHKGPSTITPAFAEPLSPYIRSRLELAERAIVEALEEVRRIKEGRP